MEDIFYLTSENITSKNIINCFDDKKIHNICFDNENVNFTLDFTHKIHTEWFYMSTSEFLDEIDILFINNNKINKIYCISHHKKDIDFLIEQLRLLLIKYRGFIGNDSIAFIPYFSLKTINNFTYLNY